jgi:hypothetical protein
VPAGKANADHEKEEEAKSVKRVILKQPEAFKV